MKTLITTIAALLLVTVVMAQETNENPILNVKESVIRINLLGVPGFSYELGLGSDFTIRPEAGLGWPVFSDRHNDEGELQSIYLESMVNPYLILEGRYYYNMQKRKAEGRRTNKFAANYIGLYYRYNAYEHEGSYDPENNGNWDDLLRDVQYLGGWWGLQRNIGQRDLFYINFSIGPGMKTNWIDYANFSVSSQFGFGLQW